MEYFIRFSMLVISLQILQPHECRNLEISSMASSDISNLNGANYNSSHLMRSNNDPMYGILKNDSSFILKEEPSSSLKESVSETCCKESVSSTVSIIDITKSVDEKLERIEHAGNETKVFEESMENSVLEPWNRIRRDNDPQETTTDECEYNECEILEDETLENKNSNEESSKELDPAETDSTNVGEDREQRNTRFSDESEDRSGLYPSWYREPSFDKRYWSSYEREPSHHFIRIPVFPGK
ncbi:hypothetical protein HZU67_03819 [Apis mellifera carnica]|nr:hypothetical protein HZU67_03819 [Apis mellifera carnica]